MPKSKPSVAEWIRGYPELWLDGSRLFCRACSKTIACERKFSVDQHVKTEIHKHNSKKFVASCSKQQTISESLSSSGTAQESATFYKDLCAAMVGTNIPLHKLENPLFKNFLEKYCQRHIPAESTLRKNYLKDVYKDAMEKIKETVGNSYIWFSVDETTDICGRYIATLLIGVLNDTPTKPFVVYCKELERTNSDTISRFINEGLTNFFLPNPLPSERILLMVTDAAAYMVKAARNLKIFYPTLIHCTCLAHGLNRVAETIRAQFPLVNDLINSGKKVFLKAPLRVQMFKEQFPDVALPPQPVVTRWGTWLNAALYYADNYSSFSAIVLQFSETSNKAINACQEVLQNAELKQNLAFIKANYKFVSESIRRLEEQGMCLTSAVEIVDNFKKSTLEVKGRQAETIAKKLDDILLKNEGFNELQKMAKVLAGERVDNLNIDAHLVPHFKYAPITSVDVERCFSIYNNILNNRRTNFKMEHLEQYLIINCFNTKNV
ncbi:uncharacterized protein LOC116170717 [Photinus pyralis]|uniref:uncharacterized protein LOC116170717 n=1 Tax=Photinus pyralis TaxID=7054 RepID=UPI00126727D5|nr:uncharacterized protein LOC116170717 [Photinus pyralis]